MSNITSCDSGSFSTENTGEDAASQQYSDILGHFHSSNSHTSTTTNNSNGSNTNSQPLPPVKKKRNQPGNPDPNAEVLALSPNTLVATNRFICEICNKGFQRDQNLQLHQRSHNLPWKLKQRISTEVRKRVYICPEPSCVHHNPARALGDLTGIKKHFSRKHGEKKWKCDKCSKKYAVYSDCKAHSKICGTKEYKCDCGTIFSRRDSFITHRAFCDALSEENNKVNEGQLSKLGSNLQGQQIPSLVSPLPINTNIHNPSQFPMSKFNHPDHKHPLSSQSLPHSLMSMPNATKPFNNMAQTVFPTSLSSNSSDPSLQLNSNPLNMFNAGSPHMSATALLQKAAQMGATMTEKSSATTSMAPPHGVMMNQYMYNFNNGNGSMNGVDMFNAILDQSKALSKISENNSRSSSNNNVVGGTKRSDEHVMTLDLLGIGVGGGGGGANGNFYSLAQQSETAATNEVIWRN